MGKKWRCRGLICLFFVVAVYAFNFARNTNYLGGIDVDGITMAETTTYTLRTGKEVEVEFNRDSLKIKDCYLLGRQERLELLAYIKTNEIVEEKCRRTIGNLEGELVAHAYLYDLGIKKASTVDADLEYIEDPRWYVRFLTGMFQLLGV